MDVRNHHHKRAFHHTPDNVGLALCKGGEYGERSGPESAVIKYKISKAFDPRCEKERKKERKKHVFKSTAGHEPKSNGERAQEMVHNKLCSIAR